MSKLMRKELFPGTVLRNAISADIPYLLMLENGLDDVVGLAKWNIPRWVYEVEHNYVWLIEQGGQMIYVVGFIHDQQKQEIDVIKLTASPVGKPLTGRLILAGAEWLQQHGVLRIKGRCAEHLLDFYKKLGFVEIGELPHYFGAGIPAYSLERVL